MEQVISKLIEAINSGDIEYSLKEAHCSDHRTDWIFIELIAGGQKFRMCSDMVESGELKGKPFTAHCKFPVEQITNEAFIGSLNKTTVGDRGLMTGKSLNKGANFSDASVFKFGKYKGQNIKEVEEVDSDYVGWYKRSVKEFIKSKK